MSASGGAGGWLVRLDRSGRAGARLALPRGRATLGRHQDCDVRVIQATVQPLHADLLVHANQTIIRNLSEEGTTLVNGEPVSVAALQHNDVITIGDRQLRWQYATPRPPLPSVPSMQPTLVVKRGGASAAGRRGSAPAAWRLALRLPHRASAPGNAGGKQVAIVQPQRRDTNEQTSQSSKEANITSRGRGSRGRSTGDNLPSRLARSPAPSPVTSLDPLPASPAAKSPKRQSRALTLPLADTSANKRVSHASPAKRQSTRSNEPPSASKRQSARSNELSPSKRQSIRSKERSASKRQSTRSNERSPTKRQSTRSNEPSPTKRQSTRSNEQSPASKRLSTISNEPSPTKRQSTRSIEPSPASKRQSAQSKEPSHTKRQSARSNEPSPTKRQSSRSSEPTPTKRQSTRSLDRSLEPSFASADTSQSKRKSRVDLVSPPSQRQSTRSNESSLIFVDTSPNKRKSRGSLVSPSSQRQSTRSSEPSPVLAGTSLTKRSSRVSPVSPLSQRQSTKSIESSLILVDTSVSKRMSRASLVSPPSQRQSTRSNEPSPVLADTSLSKLSSRATITSRDGRNSALSASSSTRQSARSSEQSPDGMLKSPSESLAKRRSGSKRKSNSPKSKSRKTASLPIGNISKRKSKTISPKGRPSSRTLTPVSALSSPVDGRSSGRTSARFSMRTPAKFTPLRVSPKTEPRRRTVTASKSTPLRMAVLRRAQSAARARSVGKIQAPATVDHTKQAALLLMTGRTLSPAPARAPRAPRSGPGDASKRQITIVNVSSASQLDSPLPATPRKSALKDPLARKSIRKTDSIKFDLSNLDSHRDSDVVLLEDSTRDSASYMSQDSASEEEITLHYSDTSDTSSPITSPSPRRSIHSRSSRILEKTGSTISDSFLTQSTITAASPRSMKSIRGSVILQKSLASPDKTAGSSRRSSRTATDQSWDTTAASAFRTMSPRDQNLESYSIVDLVSGDDSKSTSVYDSVGSTRSSSIVFGTPRGSSRQTRSSIDPKLLTSSTPYVKLTKGRSNSSPNISNGTSPNKSRSSAGSRRSKSLTTPENTQKYISLNSTRISRASRSKSRLNESDLQYISSRVDDTESPKSSRKSRKSKSLTLNTSLSPQEGTVTPENAQSPQEAGTPVLSIQSLLDSSQSSLASQRSNKRGRSSKNLKRKTIGVLRPDKKGRGSAKSKSLILTSRKSLRVRISPAHSDKTDESAPRPAKEDVTPKSAVKLVPEAVKNKHSTAKKPQSKRSIIDNLNESDIIKQLFNSPVKRKLSQSMTEFSRRQLLDDEDLPTRRPIRNTVAITGRTPDNSLLNQSDALTPERFVSPLSTPGNSPNLSGVKRLFRKNAPNNDLTDIRGVKALLRTPRARKSVRNDLTKVSGVKAVFAKSQKNRLSDVRVKEIFAEGPKNELTRFSGVRSLFQVENNDLTDVRGVKKLFTRKSVANDLNNVSGVKKVMRANTPRNDLRDVRGVRKMFKETRKSASLCDVSGIEELFNDSNNSHTERNPFDDLLDKPQAKNIYSKTYVAKRTPKSKGRQAKSLHSISAISDNVEQWIQAELEARTKKTTPASKARKSLSKTPIFKLSVTRELQKLATDTVEGAALVLEPRNRSRSLNKSRDQSQRQKSASEVYEARMLPIKKRSIAEASLEKSRTKVTILPIKKRLVVHSTPVKGRPDLTMNASELGRVSPIAPLDSAAGELSRLQQQKASPKGKAKLSPRGKPKTLASAITEDLTLQIGVSASPKPKGRKGKVITEAIPSPKPTRGRRRGQNTQEITSTSPKKAPTPKPKKNTRAKTVSENLEAVEAPKTRRTRTNTEKQTSVKESPKVRGRRAAKPVSPAKKSPVNKRTTKKSPLNKIEAKKSSVKKTSTQENLVKENPVTKQTNPSPKKTRGKAIEKPKSPVEAKPTRATRNKPQKAETNTKKRRSSLVITKKPPILSPKPAAKGKKAKPKSPAKQTTPKKVVSTRQQRAQPEIKTKTPKNTRAKGTKTSVVITKPSPVIKPQATQEKVQEISSVKGRATRNTKKVQSPKALTPKKGKKSPIATEKSVEVENTKGRKRGNKTVVEEVKGKTKKSPVATEKPLEVENTKGRKRGNKSQVEVAEKRGRRTTNASKVTSVAAKKGRKVVEKTVIEPKTKKNKSIEKLEEPPVKKGRKAADKSGNQTNITTEAGKRTRANKTVVESKPKAKPANKSVELAPTRGTRKTKTADKIEVAPVATRKRKNVEVDSTVPAKLKKTEKADGKNASPANKRVAPVEPVAPVAEGRRAARSVQEAAKPARGKTRAAPATVKSPAGRATSAARRRR